jgi:hypothetical protein
MQIIIGDIVEIPLSSGQKAYGQYVFWDHKMGPLIKIFDLQVDNEIKLVEIKNAKPLFPPIITGLFAAVKKGLWKVVGNLPVIGFEYPGFISTIYDEKTGKARTWYLWNGSESIRIGDRLPEKYKNLEYLVVWSPYDVIDRIETGKYPYPYGDLIRFNRFTPEH